MSPANLSSLVVIALVPLIAWRLIFGMLASYYTAYAIGMLRWRFSVGE